MRALLTALLAAGLADPALAQHAGHGAQPPAPAAAASPAPPIAPPPTDALRHDADAADAVYGAEAMAVARAVLREEHGGLSASKVLIDQLEIRASDDAEGYDWDGQAWYGGDIHKLWLKTEGEGGFESGLERGEVQALWSRAVDPWFDLQIGVRQDFGHGPDRTHLAVGLQGLAPYWFEVDGALFLSTEGELTARFEAEYDLRITQRLILQPLAEVDVSAQDVPELETGAGLTSVELGLRLRYEIRPEFSPYVGIQYERAFGGTADYRRTAGDDVGGWSVLAGIRTWF